MPVDCSARRFSHAEPLHASQSAFWDIAVKRRPRNVVRDRFDHYLQDHTTLDACEV